MSPESRDGLRYTRFPVFRILATKKQRQYKGPASPATALFVPATWLRTSQNESIHHYESEYLSRVMFRLLCEAISLVYHWKSTLEYVDGGKDKIKSSLGVALTPRSIISSCSLRRVHSKAVDAAKVYSTWAAAAAAVSSLSAPSSSPVNVIWWAGWVCMDGREVRRVD